ncbi:hypothetical protein EUGRSUZ_J00957 [Eucalyptus grandis]|uniref:Uncharacterized protein n=2 Tax=Eucalyptus grandis TaxID=71139 RepID=A0ACC3J556_EUCGR|nr:hypothetical protein EUGRSUZ_J00957 [Eucalyptus grandis]
MDSSGVQHQEMSGSLESMLVCTKPQQDNKKPRPQPEQALKCPRCDSTNTKFCYYNNYSLSQPRYFCKSCRRYWTKGGTLRNVPVGGGCRKNRRSSSSSSSSSKRAQDQQLLTSSANSVLNGLPGLSTFDSSDLTLAFARLQKQASGQFGLDDHDLPILGKPNIHPSDVLGNHGGFLDSLRHGFIESHQGNFQNFYYGHGGANAGDLMENGCGAGEMGLGYDQEMSGPQTTAAVTMTTMKQELCSGGEGENRILWGFPWQLNANYADGGNMMGELDSARGSGWSNGLSSPWHGLLNSPLM